MGLRIQQLPPAIANQIAAGEVIERPASVVKELLENALDAGADTISIDIAYGGLNQIKISDNGSGIFADDLPLAIAAHATSKITRLDDLYSIGSMGFRGEALASISSIAKLKISSRPASQEHAMMLAVQGSESIISPCARSQGTTIDVVDLFFNAPVRKRFLKSEKLEFQAIEIVVKRFALSAPQIALTLKHNNKLVLSLARATDAKSRHARMAKIFGKAFDDHALYIDVERAGMRLEGWLSGIEVQRSQNDRQWVYINQRMVKDKLINHAIKQAYDNVLHPGRFPVCLLYLSLNPAEVDVNVHPTKHEVRFQQPRLVHDFFTSQIHNALESQLDKPQASAVAPLTAKALNEPQLGQTQHYQYDLKPYQSSRAVADTSATVFNSGWTLLNKQFSILFRDDEPYMVDVYSLYQQWLSQELQHEMMPFDSRPLLVPISVALPSLDSAQCQALLLCLNEAGLKCMLNMENKLLLQSIPIKTPYLDLVAFITALCTHQDWQPRLIQQLLSLHHVFDVQLLSREERQALRHFFHLNYLQLHGCKALNSANCRMLLDA